jgi:hypothetical protein
MVKRGYPARAILAVAGAALLFSCSVVTGFLFMALAPPLIPVFVTILMGNTCLLTTALQFAAKVSVPKPTGMLPVSNAQKVATVAARAA